MPRVFFGPYGTQFNSHSSQQFASGAVLELPDHRLYRYALATAAARVAGKVYQAALPISTSTQLVVSTTPVAGDTTLAATHGAATLVVDFFSEGMVHTNKATGLDYGFRIRRAIEAGQAHAAVASSGVVTVNLEPGETVQVAGVSTTEITLTENRFRNTLIHDSPPTARLTGVANWAATASQYYYEQTQGPAAVTASGTLVIGDLCVPSATTDGTAMPSAALETDGPIIGIVAHVNITAETALIDLQLE
ncbi:MAG: hypothetical protein J3T61_00840 [Candidatus Brocadiales bacterium]|nr:hypothetical protein [Candidatus Bathyanammoxibius sp.]